MRKCRGEWSAAIIIDAAGSAEGFPHRIFTYSRLVNTKTRVREVGHTTYGGRNEWSKRFVTRYRFDSNFNIVSTVSMGRAMMVSSPKHSTLGNMM